MAIQPGSLVSRRYNNFRGVDFTNKDVSLSRSPDALNMWKDYKNDLGKTIETRPGLQKIKSTTNSVYGLFFYVIGNQNHSIEHVGTKLYDNGKEIKSGMNPKESYFFVVDNKLYIRDGLNYLVYDGTTIKDVEGYVPRTTIGRKPGYLNGGTPFQKVNMLSDYRVNSFVGDGKETKYYLDAQNISSDWIPEITIFQEDGSSRVLAVTEYTWNSTEGSITFKEAPSEPLTDGQDNVYIKYKKVVSGHKNRVLKSNLTAIFNNTIFISGNVDYPNVMWFSEYEDPTYFPDTSYCQEGLEVSPIQALITGNNALWVFKYSSNKQTTAFYHNPVVTTDPTSGITRYEYPSTHSSITTGCVSTGINFNDDILFFSERGIEAISGDINSEQALAHRSSMVDSRMTQENFYYHPLLSEYMGYLMVVLGNKVYLADSRAVFTNENHYEYEWFYWELEQTASCVYSDGYDLYIGTNNGIYTLSPEENQNVVSYWTTPEDDFSVPQYQKTTNKRGCTISMEGEEISVSSKCDNKEFENIGTYQNTKGYVVSRIKKKKWKTLQLKLSSNKPFGLYEVTLESFVGGYVKR